MNLQTHLNHELRNDAVEGGACMAQSEVAIVQSLPLRLEGYRQYNY